MAKIAVLISGELRTFKVCRPSMTFLDDPRVDVYVSTWSETKYDFKDVGLFHQAEVTKETVMAILDRHATILVEPVYSGGGFVDRMIHRWVGGFKLIVDSGVEYERVLIVRPDIYFLSGDNPLEYSIDADSLSFQQRLTPDGKLPTDNEKSLMDTVIWGSWRSMRRLFDDLTVSRWFDAGIDEIHWHEWWWNYIVNNMKFKVIYKDNISVFCRHGCERIPENAPYKIRMIVKHLIEWNELRTLNYWLERKRNGVTNHENKIDKNANIVEIESRWRSGYYDDKFGLMRK
jgi:hypothetical protein